jgi:glycosyltransferase involved in cell wall biosynthesis
VTTVSVCIANHNYGRYVGRAVESCPAQTHEDLEIIVVDDGSTDDSLGVLEQFAGRITCLSQPNSGQFISVRRAFEASRGDLVIFLDADDLLDPTTAARAASEFQRVPGAARIQWRLRVIVSEGEPTSDTFPPREWKMPAGDLRDHILRRRTYIWPPTSGNAYPRSVLDLVFSVAGDETPLIDLLLAETTPLIGPVVNLDGVGGSYRWHGGNFSGSW